MSLAVPKLQNLRNRGFFDADEIILDIMFGEGGDDSKIFVDELFSAYLKYSQSLGFKSELLLSEDGHVVAQIRGSGAGRAFQHEPGQHVVQRIPPTESKGRRQTSVVRVGVLPLPPESITKPLLDSELEISFALGTGPGGQHRQKTASCVRLKHKPTGLQVVIDGRDQHQNRRTAIRILTVRVNELYASREKAAYNSERRELMGDGGRGEKVRTYNFLDSRVVDHRLGTKTGDIKGIMKGNFHKILGK